MSFKSANEKKGAGLEMFATPALLKNAIATVGLVLTTLRCVSDASLLKHVRLAGVACAPFAINLSSAVMRVSELQGAVLSTDGVPLSGADVRVRRVKSRVELVRANTTESGGFTFSNLEPGAYQLEVCRPGFNASVSVIRVSPAYDRVALKIHLHVAT